MLLNNKHKYVLLFFLYFSNLLRFRWDTKLREYEFDYVQSTSKLHWIEQKNTELREISLS